MKELGDMERELTEEKKSGEEGNKKEEGRERIEEVK